MYFSGGAVECVMERNKLNAVWLNVSFKADDGSYLRGGGVIMCPVVCLLTWHDCISKYRIIE